MGYSVVDLGHEMVPQGLNNRGDVILSSGTKNFVRLVDGTLITLPSAFTSVLAINNNRDVLVAADKFSLYNLETSTIEPIPLPDYPTIEAKALNYSGDVVGWMANSRSYLDGMRVFIFHRNTQTVTWVLPTLPSPITGAATWVLLTDINDLGHATGFQGI
jgi:hypothetical protein